MRTRDNKKRELGIALFVTLFALLLLSAIALGMMYSANMETSINGNYRDLQKASYAAKAGLEEARERIRTGAPDQIALPTALPSNSTPYVAYILNSSSVTPWSGTYADTEILREFNLSSTSSACGASSWCATYSASSSFAPPSPASALDYKWVRITRKSAVPVSGYQVGGTPTPTASTSVCYDGKNEQPLPSGALDCTSTSGQWQPVYILTSLAVTPTGAKQMSQMEVAPSLPITVDGTVTSQDDVTLNGSYVLNGYDNCACQLQNGQYVNRSGKVCTSKYALYTSGSITTNGSSGSSISGTNPVQVSSQPWNYNIPNMINQFKNQPGTVFPAGQTCAGSNCGNYSNSQFGTYPSGLPDNPTGGVPQVTYFPGSVKLTANNSAGDGILIVDGDLNINGGLNFYGLILVKGVVTFTGGGSSAVNIYGAILAGQEVGASDTTLGGSVNFHYDTCALHQWDPTKQPFNVLSKRDITF
jgi:hypothetical protein